MVNGVAGVTGRDVHSHVEVAGNLEHVRVTTPPPDMAELPVPGPWRQRLTATHIAVQVNRCFVYVTNEMPYFTRWSCNHEKLLSTEAEFYLPIKQKTSKGNNLAVHWTQYHFTDYKYPIYLMSAYKLTGVCSKAKTYILVHFKSFTSSVLLPRPSVFWCGTIISNVPHVMSNWCISFRCTSGIHVGYG